MNKVILSALAVLCLSIVSCTKYKDSSTAVITIKKKNGNGVSGATVTLTSLYAINTPGVQLSKNLPVKQTTDADGKAFMEIKYEGVLDVLVKSPLGDTTDFIKLKIGEETQKEIILNK